MINSIHAPTVSASVGVVTIKPVSSPLQEIGSSNVKTTPLESTEISTLSRQLSDSAERAEKRDNSMSRSQLGDLARKLSDQFSGNVYTILKATHDREVPETDDPELLARARQATKYVNNAATGARDVKSPFAGLSREQLTLIAYDDGGAYTVNERRAADYGISGMEEQWRKKVVALSWVESSSNSNRPKFFTEVLAHYKTLPLIDQAQYPADYELRLQARIDEGDAPPERKKDHFLSLVEILANMYKSEKDTDSTALDIKANNVSPVVSPTTGPSA